ncbi:DUF3043 domain-containing protein [Gardnerella sp. 2492-Sm]|uniref:DUF3043 domain-containing protein n=1 Tax=unclassified Gardnerella TaxID=2628112 RepID=UPI003D07725C
MTWNLLAKKSAAGDAANNAAANASEKAAAKAEMQSAAAQKTREKNAPTPKRNAVQAEKLRPLVPADRKASAKRARARLRERENEQYEAMKSGDLTHMPKSEQLPWRIYIRDYVDARRNLTEFFFPFAILIMVCLFFAQGLLGQRYVIVYFGLAVALYAYILLSIIDLIVMWRKLKKKLIKKFGDAPVQRGSRSAMYAFSRALQVRIWRLPKPSSKKRGNWPK